MLVVSCSGGLSSVWGDASKAGSQIVFCTCALQPDDNSSSDRSFAGFVLLFVTQREIPALDSLFFSRPGHTSLSPRFSTPLPRPPAIAPEISSTPKGFQATVIPSRARSLSTSGSRDLIAIDNDDIIRKRAVPSAGSVLLF